MDRGFMRAVSYRCYAAEDTSHSISIHPCFNLYFQLSLFFVPSKVAKPMLLLHSEMNDWLKGLEAFDKTWFPEDAKEGRVVPGFWFGARKASYKSFFEKLEVECLEAARCLVSRMLPLKQSTTWRHLASLAPFCA